MKFLVLISIILCAKSCFGLVCYSCNSGQNPKCGDDLTDTNGIDVSQCKTSDEFCVTFYNRFDNNNIYRGCSGNFYVPEELETVNNTCVLDSYTIALFCSCNDKDLCNRGKMQIYT
ncbi:hypothetical protein BpHYR1_048807 [Brachionus plicatilis]|uniref:Protein sleepless n=1 Tax=Brachionus plicatilis TaxID=10195 RepID=A0A3M7SN61_BRAPC|nr:hypothetical protein BpHYR1_048807 [Brachionus plicatilis]